MFYLYETLYIILLRFYNFILVTVVSVFDKNVNQKNKFLNCVSFPYMTFHTNKMADEQVTKGRCSGIKLDIRC